MEFKVAIITWANEADLLKYHRTRKDEDLDPERVERYQIEADTAEKAARKLMDRFIADGGKVIKTKWIADSYILMPNRKVYESATAYYPNGGRKAGFECDAYSYSVAQIFGLYEEAKQ